MPRTTVTNDPTNSENTRYLSPDWFTRNVMNPTVRGLTRLGVGVWGSRILEVPGRKSGRTRSTPVNLLVVDGVEYLVAPRGVTQWVRNVRVAETATLRVGRRVDRYRFEELDDDAKPMVLRPYLRRWKWEVGQFFEGVGPDATDDELRAVAGGYPVFRLSPA